jgi:phosphoribosyl-ATP pyrophosphohydrolase
VIIPSIDIQEGRAVQLRHGRELVLEGGTPDERLEQFAVAGEVAVVDLDAALSRGTNSSTIRRLVRRAPCRVGGGIRTLEAALEWLDAGAAKIMIGTACTVELCSALPRERVIAAVDAERGELVVDGWRTRTGIGVLDRIRELAPYAGGFLLTQVEKEGDLAGFDLELVRAAVAAAGDARVVAAGGVRSAEEIAELDAIGVDAQVGMALYSGVLSLGEAVAGSLCCPVAGELWPTVVCDEHGVALGLVWSTRESVALAIDRRQGIYWSRSRQRLWVKGETSGARQQLVRVDLDCDRDALRFVVRQSGSGFCHRGSRGCWGDDFNLAELERVLLDRLRRPEPGSGTTRLFSEPELLASKLREEANELAAAESTARAASESADLLYFLMAALVARGGSLEAVTRELAARRLVVRRRPMEAKDSPEEPAR